MLPLIAFSMAPSQKRSFSRTACFLKGGVQLQVSDNNLYKCQIIEEWKYRTFCLEHTGGKIMTLHKLDTKGSPSDFVTLCAYMCL